jgi:ankyrin repeat protein
MSYENLSEGQRGVGQADGRTPLMITMYPFDHIKKQGCIDLIALELLLDAGADPNLKNNAGRTALSYLFASETGAHSRNDQTFASTFDTLLGLMKTHGCDVNAEVDDDLNTLLGLAAGTFCGRQTVGAHTFRGELVDALLRHGAEVNKANRAGVTPLMYGCTGTFEVMAGIVTALLNAGANAAAIDNAGNTALHYAAQNSDEIAAKKLTRLLCDLGTPDAGAVNNAGQTALAIAVRNKNEQLARLLMTLL